MSVRNKQNPFFAKENHVRVTKVQKTKPVITLPEDGD